MRLQETCLALLTGALALLSQSTASAQTFYDYSFSHGCETQNGPTNCLPPIANGNATLATDFYGRRYGLIRAAAGQWSSFEVLVFTPAGLECGVAAFAYTENADNIYFSALDPQGRIVQETPPLNSWSFEPHAEFTFRPTSSISRLRLGYWGNGSNSFLELRSFWVSCR